MNSAPSQEMGLAATALRWAIHSTGLIIGLTSLLFVAWWAMVFFLAFFATGQGEQEPVRMLLVSLFIWATFILLAKVGWDMFQKLNEASVANLAFLVAALFANIWYQFLPIGMPEAVARFARENGFLSHLMGNGPRDPWTFRGILAFLAFIVFYNLLKAWFVQKLGLIRPTPPAPPEDDEPVQPFVPFDPYQPAPQSSSRPPPK